MIPETLVGIVAFAAGAGPGYYYVQLAERYAPRRDRSQIEEAAELLVVGSVSTGGALLLVLWLASLFTELDAPSLADAPRLFIFAHPGPALLVFGSTLAISYVAVWLAATQLVYRGRQREVQPGGTMWYAAFKQLVPTGHGTLITIERKDGSALTGLLGSANADDGETREILVIRPENRPIYARAAGGEPVALTDTFVIVRGEDVATLAGRYLPVSPADAEAHQRRRWRRH